MSISDRIAVMRARPDRAGGDTGQDLRAARDRVRRALRRHGEFLDGEVAETSATDATVTALGILVVHVTQPLARGAKVRLVVRPEAVRLSATEPLAGTPARCAGRVAVSSRGRSPATWSTPRASVSPSTSTTRATVRATRTATAWPSSCRATSRSCQPAPRTASGARWTRISGGRAGLHLVEARVEDGEGLIELRLGDHERRRQDQDTVAAHREAQPRSKASFATARAASRAGAFVDGPRPARPPSGGRDRTSPTLG